VGESGKAFLERMAKIDPRSREEREAEREGDVFVNRRASEPVIADLRAAGFRVQWIADLRLLNDYRAAKAILLKWLSRMQNRDVKEDIIRALSAPWAKPEVVPLFVEEFRRCEDDDLRWAIGNGLEMLAEESMFETLAELAQDRRYGRARQMVVLALGKIKNPRAADILISQLDDREVGIMAITALGKLKAKGARHHIEKFLADPIADYRREAKKALTKIDKAR
jgi:HEAT repeat protein